MTPKKLTVAPDSVYGGNVKKSDGTVYFLTVNYANVNGDPTKVHSSDINQLELHPDIASSQKGKTFYSSVPGCDNGNDCDDIPVGKSQDTWK